MGAKAPARPRVLTPDEIANYTLFPVERLGLLESQVRDSPWTEACRPCSRSDARGATPGRQATGSARPGRQHPGRRASPR